MLNEPIEEVLTAMLSLQEQNVFLYVSGNYKKLSKSVRNRAPSNFIFTEYYLPDEALVSLLYSVDMAMALTTAYFCVLCGCYEAVAAEKPLITSNKNVLRACEKITWPILHLIFGSSLNVVQS